MHTQSFTIPQFLKIGLTQKIVPSGVTNCRNMPFCGRARQGSRVRFPKEERCAESPPTFICGKRRKNQRKPVKKNIPSSGVVFTFEEGISTSHVCLKGQQPIFENCVKLCYLNFYFFFIFEVNKSGALAPTYPPSKRKSDLRNSFLRVNQAILFTWKVIILRRWTLKMIHLLGKKNWGIELSNPFLVIFVDELDFANLILTLVSL